MDKNHERFLFSEEELWIMNERKKHNAENLKKDYEDTRKRLSYTQLELDNVYDHLGHKEIELESVKSYGLRLLEDNKKLTDSVLEVLEQAVALKKKNDQLAAENKKLIQMMQGRE